MAILVLLCLPASAQIVQFSGASSGTTFQTLKIGGGGFIGNIDIATDGTKVARTDVYGAYGCAAPCTPAGTPGWVQLAQINRFPANDPGVGIQLNDGAYEIRIAPSNTSRWYMYLNGYVYRSNDNGASWTPTSFSPVAAKGSDQVTETFGPYMAVDPANADILFVGTPGSNLFYTTNGGTSFNTVSSGSVPASSASPPGSTTPQNGGIIIAFDPSTTSGGATPGIYASSYGNGVYHSTNGGSSWSKLSSTGMPTTGTHLIVDANGKLYLIDSSANINYYTGGAWAKYTTGLPGSGGSGNNPIAIAVDPNNANNVVVASAIENTSYSTNGGTSWSSSGQATWTSTDVAWLATAEVTGHGSVGNIVFDPNQSNVLYVAEGIGVWHLTPSTSSTITWISQTAGIENLVANWAISPPGGNPVFVFDDRPIFVISNPAAYPSGYFLQPASGNPINNGFSADWASSSASTIVAIGDKAASSGGAFNNSSYSSNGGSTWTIFTGLSAITDLTANGGAFEGGNIAALTASNYCWAVGADSGGTASASGIWCTTDSGAHWTSPSITGITNSSLCWNQHYYFEHRQILSADRSNGDFYIYCASGTSSTAGVYSSTNGGTSWSRVNTGQFDSGQADRFDAQMRSVPGEAGWLFYTSGSQTCSPSCPIGQAFHYSSNAGVSWSLLSNVEDVWAFGFGKAGPSSDGFPALYCYCWINKASAGYVGGVWRIDNVDGTPIFTQLSSLFPINSFDQVQTVEGDANTYGTVYVGFAGSGFAVGTIH